MNSPTRFFTSAGLGALALAGSLLIQSCSKESEAIPPAPSARLSSNNTQALQIISASGAQGTQVQLGWVEFNYGGQPATAGTARVEMDGPIHLIFPHALLYSAEGVPVGTKNGFDFGIPAYMPAGSYSVTVTTDKPNTSLVHDTGGAPNETSAQGTLTVTQNTVAATSGILRGALSADPNGSIIDVTFPITWPELNTLSNRSRPGMQNTSTGVYYLLGPTPGDAGNMDDFPYKSQPYYSYGVANEVNGADGYKVMKISMADVPSGNYKIYLDAMATYGSQTNGRSYIYSASTYAF